MAEKDFSHLTNDELIKGIQALKLPEYIRSKAYGVDVRETIAQLTEMTIQFGVNLSLDPDEALKWARKLQESVSQSEFDSWVATLLDGGPSIFMNTLSELQSVYPNGAPGIALVRETDPAKIYVWNGTAWEDFGDYQGLEVKDGSITKEKIDSELLDSMGIITATNLITSNFEEVLGWYNSGGSALSVLNNRLTVSGSSSAKNPGVVRIIYRSYSQVSKLYVKMRIRSTGSQPNFINANVRGGTTAGTVIEEQLVISPETNVWYTPSFIMETDGSGSGNTNLGIESVYQDTGLAGGSLIEIEKLIVLDLTEIFGVGNEPSAEEMDVLLEKFPNGWFMGTEVIKGSPDEFKRLESSIVDTDDELNTLKTHVYEGMPNHSDIGEHDIKYYADVKNRTNVPYSNGKVKLYVSFDEGVCRNEKTILVKNQDGVVVPHQWESAEDANFKTDRNFGYYYDGFLKDGYIWVIDDFEPNETKHYEIYVYTKEVSILEPKVSLQTVGDNYRLETNDISINFAGWNQFLSNEFMVNNTSHPLVQGLSYQTAVGVNSNPMNSPSNASIKEITSEGSGVVFKDFIVVLENDMLEATITTRLFSNGIINEKVRFKAKRTLLGTEIASMEHRLEVGNKANGSDVYKERFTRASRHEGGLNQAIHVLFTHGDIPRNDVSRPFYPAITHLIDDPERDRFIVGWQYNSTHTLFDIPSGEVFASEIEMNLIGFSDSVESESARVFNPIVGRVNNETKHKIKKDLFDLTMENISNVMEDSWYRATSTSPFVARLMLSKTTGEESLSKISADYRSLVKSFCGYDGVGTGQAMIDSWESGGWATTYSSRIFPASAYLLKENKELGNTDEVQYYEGLISTYAEIAHTETNLVGYMPQSHNGGKNSNSLTAGMRALGAGLELNPTNQDWIDSFNANEIALKEFLAIDNITTDTPSDILSRSHYIHYATYTYFEYLKALEHINKEPVFNLVSYPFNATASYGAVREQEYCISSSRRGLGHTVAYIAYLLTSEDTPSSLSQAKKVMERLIEQNIPMGGHEFPLENWRYEEAQPYNSSAPFELNVLGELAYYLLK